MLLKNANIITKTHILYNTDLLIENNLIKEIGQNLYFTDLEVETIDCTNKYLSPGFIDIHVHGGGGGDFMDKDNQDIYNILNLHTKHGTTTMFPTTLAGDIDETINAIKRIYNISLEDMPFCKIKGVHLEGPYFNKDYKGAQPEKYIKIPVKAEYENLLQHDIIKRVSFAPEIENGKEFAKYLVEKNIIGSLAHTGADYNDIIDMKKIGITLITHLYSCMPIVHREKGYRKIGIPETSFLEDDICVEIISDGKHLPKELLKLIYKIKGADKIALVTDAMRGAGQTAGVSTLGDKDNGQQVFIRDGVAFMPDGENFAGSIATMDILVKNMVNLASVSIVDAIKMASYTPAKFMKIDKYIGSIEKNKIADILILNNNLDIDRVIINGKMIK